MSTYNNFVDDHHWPSISWGNMLFGTRANGTFAINNERKMKDDAIRSEQNIDFAILILLMQR